MLEKLKIWWFFKVVRSAANTFIYHKQQIEEWTHRYVTDSEETRKKQVYYIQQHKDGMQKCVHMLKYSYKIPEREWVPVGEGMEVWLDTHYKTELQDRIQILEGGNIVKLQTDGQFHSEAS